MCRYVLWSGQIVLQFSILFSCCFISSISVLPNQKKKKKLLAARKKSKLDILVKINGFALLFIYTGGDRSMYCGGTQYEPFICCPKSPLEQNSVCGKTLVSGQFYRGLGAFPFVARVGFKSKFFTPLFTSLFMIIFEISVIIK